ncbi:TPA: N-acetyltransferase family protein [Streptococcus suis]|uniref:GCN5-related N-acetyltransferase n=1 Tax=Streptococcus suis (strain GZ1) TaxID=423211 RepID=D5AJW6_STRGZ|nr:GNAT family N-acetyltransferase [Streptococcus suis]ABP90825.1 Histone acetyltransferase HPA2 and related acetyltransferases [Streptococcus suis 05ZYH33]ABP93020.1 Histone acetyltransferase HPA2 and related acetyltransferases [Streptococcus suis 98HAH33]ADE32131.1 GCN5-related N-acetyltransferase [Streptococcus suis GZ1]ADV70874.1 histone acetyltransferase HPA2-like acetyltransferase [Streptococcus suis JS14]AER15972.1 histone acetyltransferase HPA2-like acetyltransferase [Streptococcus sui
MSEKEVYFSEAEPADAAAFIDFMNQVARETDYLVMDETGFRFSVDEIETIFDAGIENPRELCLLAKVGSEVVGAISVKSSKQFRISHIGNIFIAVKKAYWGHGIGTILLEEVLHWAEEMDVLKRLELTVQVRNQAAVHLYQKLGFNIEGTQIGGARTDEGEWLDLYYMGKLIGEV